MKQKGPCLGDRVRFVQAKDIEGIVEKEERFLDGSRRWDVSYWIDGKRISITVDAWEIEVVLDSDVRP